MTHPTATVPAPGRKELPSMQPKQFAGASIDEVLPQIRTELGEDAVILATKRVVRGGIGGFFGKEGVEVTAAAGAAGPPPAATSAPAATSVALDVRTPDEALTPAARAAANLAAAESAATAAPPAAPAFARHLQVRLDAAHEAEAGLFADTPAGAGAYAAAGRAPFAPGGDERGAAILEAARDAVRQARATAEGPLRSPADAAPPADDFLALAPAAASAPAPPVAPDAAAPAAAPVPAAKVHRRLAGVRRELRAAGVEERHLDPMLDALARERLPFLSDGEDLREVVRAWMADRLPVCRDWAPAGGGRMVALVGQSGVGKTTAVIGLARRLVAAGTPVGVVALGDGPGDALEAATRRIGVPTLRVDDAAGLARARSAFGPAHVVLVDTPGRSQGDREGLAALAALLAAARPEEVHLVLPLASAPADVTDLARAFRPLGFRRLLVTKLDETRRPGNLVNLPLRAGRPLSHLSDAPQGPAGVRPAGAGDVARLLLP